jgi:uncharacterized protein (DUF58 family)
LITPTRLAIWATAAGVPVTMLLGAFVPDLWYASLAWPAGILVLTGLDAVLGASPGAGTIMLDLPATAPVGGDVDAGISVVVSGKGAPDWCEVALDNDPLLVMADEGRIGVALSAGKGEALLPMVAIRRGAARVESAWLRWRGPLGLTWKQRRMAMTGRVEILPDVRPVHERGAAIFQRQALQGLLAQIDRGDGTDFDALVEFRSGMDRRAIDWKQSARHLKLHAKEYRSERNSQIVFAMDCGRQMSEPVAGLPRIDRAVSAMLLIAWIMLKLGDRVALHAFDSRPRIGSGLVSGVAAFRELQSLAADIDYSGDEPNYTFALTQLATLLKRRSMIVLFTEFGDPTSADFMIRAAARLVETHLLLVVVFRDDELESIVDHPPETAADVTKAVTAAALLRDRHVALLRLRNLGAHVIEAPYNQVAEHLVAAYIDLKRRDLL